MNGVFVTGTDSGVGKTTVCAGLIRLLHGNVNARYWKPVQTGTIFGDDTNEVKTLTGLPADRFIGPAYRFPDPVAPFIAARNFDKTIDVPDVIKKGKTYLAESFVIIEGAGGLLVPLTSKSVLKDLNEEWKLPVLLVAENRLGTINQVLLTMESCKISGFNVLGVVLTKSEASKRLGNAECIEHLGGVKVLAEFPMVQDRSTLVAQVSCDEGLRKTFGVKPIP